MRPSEPDPAPPKRARPSLARRAALSLASAAATLLLLEIAVRLALPVPAPVRLRDGVYVHQLPMVNGRDTVYRVTGEPLAQRKREGEVRVFVFGESSVEGAPWGYRASPVTMLHDQLRAALPDRDVTVVNMGRSASLTRDAFYFLLTIAPYAPDYVVFYQGANDFFQGDPETCTPSTRPRLHAAWRWLVARSRLAFAVRARAPAIVAKLRHTERRQAIARDVPDSCDPVSGFRAWSELLVDTAARMGARVIVTTPVESPWKGIESREPRVPLDAPLAIAGRSEPYRRLVACALEPSCDAAAALEAAGGAHLSTWVALRGQAWKESAARHHGLVVDFAAELAAHEAGGLSPPIFAEEVHLTIAGYWLLASLWTRALAPLLDARAAAHPFAPPPLDEGRYLGDVVRELHAGAACLLLHPTAAYLRTNEALLAAWLLRLSIAIDHGAVERVADSRAGAMAQLLAARLRQGLGLPPSLPAALAPLLADVQPGALPDRLRDRFDCETVGPSALADVVAAARPTDPADRAANALDGAGDVGGTFVIPAGQESAIVALLTVAPTTGCRLDDAQIERSSVHAVYVCGAARPAIELRHREPNDPVATERFAIVQSGGAPRPDLVRAVADSVRRGEATFRWQRPR